MQQKTLYQNNQIWLKVQEFLPPENRLFDKEIPVQEWVETDHTSIHVDHYVPQKTKAVVVVLHGVGGNGRLLSFIAMPLWRQGYEVICPDLPMYGHTVVKEKISYEDWVKSSVLISEKYMREGIPFFLFGLSAGGMLAYQTACRLKDVTGIMVTCLLDQRISKVTLETASNKIMAKLGKPLLKMFNNIFGGMRLPMKAVCNMKAIVNNEKLAKILLEDPLSSGAKVTLRFLHGLLNPSIEIEAKDFNKCPIILVHPEKDYWTDISLSRMFFDEMPCEKRIQLLEGAGHFPIEERGLKQLEEFCILFMEEFGKESFL